MPVLKGSCYLRKDLPTKNQLTIQMMENQKVFVKFCAMTKETEMPLRESLLVYIFNRLLKWVPIYALTQQFTERTSK